MDGNCYTCKHFSELKEHRDRSDGYMVYGYCFKDGTNHDNPNINKGFAVFFPNGKCEQFERDRNREGIKTDG